MTKTIKNGTEVKRTNLQVVIKKQGAIGRSWTSEGMISMPHASTVIEMLKIIHAPNISVKNNDNYLI